MFIDRSHAGHALAGHLLNTVGPETPVVLGMPRGGVPVAYEVALALRAALDIVAVRKVGAPRQPEYGIGAVTEDGEVIYDRVALRRLGLTAADLDTYVARERAEVSRAVELYRGGRAVQDIARRHVIVVDDGLATGMSARAALRTVTARGPSRVTFAAPVGAPEAIRELSDEIGIGVDIVCLERPRDFGAVGYWYANFAQVSDSAVIQLLSAAVSRGAVRPAPPHTGERTR